MLLSQNAPALVKDCFIVKKGFLLVDDRIINPKLTIPKVYVRRGAKFTVSVTVCPKHKKCKCSETGKFTPSVILEGSTPGAKEHSAPKPFLRTLNMSYNYYREGIISRLIDNGSLWYAAE